MKTEREALKLALGKIKAARDCHPKAVQTLVFEAEELLEEALAQPDPLADAGKPIERIDIDSRTIDVWPAQPEQGPVAWPCRIESSDFEANTIVLEMLSDDYVVAAGPHWLCPTPPKPQPLTDEQKKAIAESAIIGHAGTRAAIVWAIEYAERQHGIGAKVAPTVHHLPADDTEGGAT